MTVTRPESSQQQQAYLRLDLRRPIEASSLARLGHGTSCGERRSNSFALL